jgi:hypothetical protein
LCQLRRFSLCRAAEELLVAGSHLHHLLAVEMVAVVVGAELHLPAVALAAVVVGLRLR